MAQSVVLNGVTYSIPSPGDSDEWGAALNAYLVALGTAAGAKSPIVFTFGGSQLENATRYLTVGGNAWPLGAGKIPTGAQLVSVPCAGSITRLDVQLSVALASTLGTVVFTVQKLVAGVATDQAMTVTLTCSAKTGTLAHVSTTSGSFTVVAGDAVSIKVLDVSTNSAVQGITATLTLTPS